MVIELVSKKERIMQTESVELFGDIWAARAVDKKLAAANLIRHSNFF